MHINTLFYDYAGLPALSDHVYIKIMQEFEALTTVYIVFQYRELPFLIRRILLKKYTYV